MFNGVDPPIAEIRRGGFNIELFEIEDKGVEIVLPPREGSGTALA